MTQEKYTDEDIAAILDVSPRHIHNTAKRGFNKLLAELMVNNKGLKLLEILSVLMDEFDLDGEEVKKMLNGAHLARCEVELIDEFCLKKWGNIDEEEYQKQRKRAKLDE